MKEIKLCGASANGKSMIIDDDDYGMVNKYSWNISIKDKNEYASAYLLGSGHRGTRIYAHRLIMNAERGQHIDHKNGDGLDNRRGNLRISTNQENHFNTRKKSKSSSIYKGVTWENRRKHWVAQIMIDGKHIYIGKFDSEVDAAKAYDSRAKELFGDFANLNFSK